MNVTGTGPRFLADKNLDSKVLKVFMSKFNFTEELLSKTWNSLIFEIKGHIKEWFGSYTVLNVTTINGPNIKSEIMVLNP